VTEFYANFDIYPEIVTVPNYHNGQPARFRVFYSDFISSTLYKGEVWEPHMHALFKRYITKDSVVIDGGAHIGAHSVKLALLAKKVYCFEPLTPSRLLLNENLMMNGCLNVVVSSEGLGEAKRTGYLGWVTNENIGGSGLHRGDETSTIAIDITTIDALDLPQLDFIKLDIEQYEPLAVAGGMHTIEKFLPAIALECWDGYPESSLQHAMIEYEALLDLGYTASRVDDNAPDYLFTHRDRG
jgi:FkbM family methyltransferase